MSQFKRTTAGEEFRKFGELYVTESGRVYLTDRKTEFPYFFRKNSPYFWVLNFGNKYTVHGIMGKVWLNNPAPSKFDRVDHQNRCPLDNRRSNLLWVNATLNSLNRLTRGYSWDKNIHMWVSSFTANKIYHLVGSFKSTYHAHRATQRAKMFMFNLIYERCVNEERNN